MDWWQYALLGGLGGAIVEVLELFRWVSAWQAARRDTRGLVRREPPAIRVYVDLPAHLCMLMLRVLLGCCSAAIFAAAGQLKGGYVAVALGFCGPALLWKLGQIPQINEAIAGSPTHSEPSSTLVPPSPRSAGQGLPEAAHD
jgi:hypothetical protein